jgi:hypothetical protein
MTCQSSHHEGGKKKNEQANEMKAVIVVIAVIAAIARGETDEVEPVGCCDVAVEFIDKMAEFGFGRVLRGCERIEQIGHRSKDWLAHALHDECAEDDDTDCDTAVDAIGVSLDTRLAQFKSVCSQRTM